jgi:Protein of unknown function (DUF1553)/Protein of unknown function (DUF1549)/Planctomycete cytochrome C
MSRGGLWAGMCALLIAWSGVISTPVRAADPSAGDVEFFEKKIRPIFVAHCYECHSGTKSKGGLRLDLSEGWIRGGDSGAAVVPGKPDESPLINAVRHNGPEMPPTGKLPAETIQLLEQWVARGAPAPPGSESAAKPAAPMTVDLEAGRKFWAYQAPREPALPDSDEPMGDVHPIDRLVRARLDAEKLRPSTPAERAMLVRRLYFDLWGLPPDPAELDACAHDTSSDWYEKLVDRLLASPRFGERWGRHWLDIVRYGESLTLRGFILPDAWRYRDYVIENFNHDRPYDRFLREQIAGDLLPAVLVEDRQRQLIATTFLALGNTNLEEQDKRQLDMDVVDEQLDVLGKAFLAQTIGCARCHDHKFDPIPTRDYYALAGILRNVQALEHENVSKWMTVPLPLPPPEEAEFARQETALAQISREIEETRGRIADLAGNSAGTDLLRERYAASVKIPGIVVDDSQARKVGQWQTSQHTKPFVGAGYIHDLDEGKGDKTVTFVPELPGNGRYEVRLAYTPGSNRAADVPVTVFSADGEKLVHVNMQQRPPLDGRFVSLGEYRCEVAGQSFVLVTNENTRGHVVVDAVQFLPADEVARTAERGKDEPSGPSNADPDLDAQKKKLQTLENDLKRMRAAAAKHPTVMTVIEREKVEDVAVHFRGSVHTLGEVAPRGFLQVVAPRFESQMPAEESGRVQLAEWLAAADNPLTARVYVNRAWHWLFGQGLVRTVDNFGSTGELPSHPELLDHLALRFIARGWSVKQLVRYIVMSQTYRQSSAERPDALAADPENRLLWRNSRHRLEAECLRDAMLLISGQLCQDTGGSTIRAGTTADYDYVDTGTRRSVYLPVLRNALPEFLDVFDFPDPSMVVGRRNVSTVAPQALLLMNHPFVRGQAEAAARRLLALELTDDEARVQRAYRQVLGRAPTTAEREVVEQSLATSESARQTEPAPSRVEAWTEVYHLLFSSLDFRYRD